MGGTANYTMPNPPRNEFGFFTHTVRTKANSIKFALQSMCSPTISTLLKAIRRGYLDGCPNLSAKGVTRYLNPSPATAKGHMKRPHQGIRSTTAHQPHPPPSGRQGPTVHATPIADDDSWIDDISEPSIQAGPFTHGPAVLVEDDNSSVGNIFVLRHLQTSKQEFCITISPGRFPTCPSRAMCATSSCTTTNPMQSLDYQYPGSMTTLCSQRTKPSSNFWRAKDTR